MSDGREGIKILVAQGRKWRNTVERIDDIFKSIEGVTDPQVMFNHFQIAFSLLKAGIRT